MAARQICLFSDEDLHPTWARARKSDPVTSHSAAECVEASGVAAQRRAAITESLRRNPEQTFREIAADIQVDPVEVMRRLNDLERARLVEKVGIRTCGTGRAMTTWRLVKRPE